MQLSEMIDKRRSVRSYTSEAIAPETLTKISAFMEGLVPLIPGAKVAGRLVDTEQGSFLQKWRTPHFIAVFSDGSDDGLLNVGFMYQQLDLYAQSLGLGTCWVGLGSLKDEGLIPPGMKLAVMMAIGVPDGVNLRDGAKDFSRRSLQDVTDLPDPRLEPLRLAPSATNSQPWYVTHEGDVLHIWREALGVIKQRTHGRMNKIDTGIALSHLYVTHPESFRFFRAERAPEKEGYLYMGSVTL